MILVINGYCASLQHSVPTSSAPDTRRWRRRRVGRRWRRRPHRRRRRWWRRCPHRWWRRRRLPYGRGRGVVGVRRWRRRASSARDPSVDAGSPAVRQLPQVIAVDDALDKDVILAGWRHVDAAAGSVGWRRRSRSQALLDAPRRRRGKRRRQPRGRATDGEVCHHAKLTDRDELG